MRVIPDAVLQYPAANVYVADLLQRQFLQCEQGVPSEVHPVRIQVLDIQQQ
jgi:hypothetical protein